MAVTPSNSIAGAGCPCDRLVIPPKPVIPAGLSRLPRQLAGFPEFRAALLSHIASHQLLDTDIVPLYRQRPLQHWLAREGDDLGIMLLEMWAYVLDVLAFYEERIANESYLQTAQRHLSLQRLVELIGYRPRPATAASVLLALLADTGKGLVTIPAGTAFRSSAFDGEPPQVFEATNGTSIDPALNRWTLAPIRESQPDLAWYAAAGDLSVDEGEFVFVSWQQSVVLTEEFPLVSSVGGNIALAELDQEDLLDLGPGGNTYVFASNPTVLFGATAKVVSTETSKALDGATYSRIEFDPVVSPDPGVALDALTFRKPVLEARVNDISSDFSTTTVQLDAVYSDIREDDLVLVTQGDESLPFRVVEVSHQEKFEFGDVPVSEDAVRPFILVTEIRLFPRVPVDWESKTGRIKVRFQFIDAGKLTRPAKDRIELADLQPDAAFEGTVEPPEKEASGTLLLAGANGNGAECQANVDITAEGVGRLLPQSAAEPFVAALRTPVKVYGNLIEATRGETVANEVLGSGDPSQAFQSFKLKKSPLTWFDDPSGANGLRSTLRVRVNGILWTEVTSFYGTGPQDEVFIIRQDDESKSGVTFGDGKTGARLPSGVANVTATYRYGAGAPKPPANSITQIARAVKGLRQVVNPVAAGGGSDADSPDDLRTNASTSSLILGRAVSLTDFEALAREFGGVINAHATWTWDGRMQRAVVKIWFISDGGSIAEDLRSHLLGQSDPNVPLEATEAEAVEKPLVVDLAVDERYNSDDVERAVIEAMANEETGLVALGNIPIGAPLFRSRVLAQIHSVDGVVSVRALRFDGTEAGAAMLVEEGQYLDFTNQLIVGNTVSGDVLF